MSVQVLIPWRDSGCPHRRAARDWVVARWRALHPRWGIVFGSCPDGPWNVAAALNDAIAKATADVVLLMGADTILDEHIIGEAVAETLTGQWVLPAATLIRYTPAATAALLDMPPATDVPFLGHHQQQSDRGWGPVIGPLEALRVTPYDERFVGWGGEDEAACITRSTLLGPPARLDGACFMLWHPAPPVHADYPGNLALLDRYDAAAGNPAALLALAYEARCDFTYATTRCTEPSGHDGAHLCASR